MRRMCARPFLGGDELFDLVREEQQADLVVVLDRRERKDGADLRSDLVLQLLRAAEAARAAQVDDQHDRQLAFFFEHFDVRVVEPRRDVPVDGADVVTVLVLPHFAELDPASLEDAVVFPREDLVHETARLDLDVPYFPEYVSGVHAVPGVRPSSLFLLPLASFRLTGPRSCSALPAPPARSSPPRPRLRRSPRRGGGARRG